MYQVRCANTRVCIEPGGFSVADDDSEVQTTLRIFQVKNIPKYPFSQTAKPTRGNVLLVFRIGVYTSYRITHHVRQYLPSTTAYVRTYISYDNVVSELDALTKFF